MVAYSFKHRFVEPIRAGLGTLTWHGSDVPKPKRQTIRAIGLRRHAHPGETLQLYCGMRSPACFLIGTALCSSVRPIDISICGDGDMLFRIERQLLSDAKAEAFAIGDGFGSIEDMWLFWRREHRGVSNFKGLVISWEEGNNAEEETRANRKAQSVPRRARKAAKR